MRVILYVGKGGVGKTTISAATAVRAAQMGYRTLVVSTDTAHSLADAFDLNLKSVPDKIADNLWAQEINVLDEVRSNWGKLESYFANILKKKGADDVIAEELALLPGMDELISLLQILRHSRSGEFDVIFIDAAPTGETVRLLSMPDMFTWYSDRVASWHNSTMKLAGALIKPLMPRNNVFDAIPDITQQVELLRTTLTSPKQASYRIVVNPEKMVVKEGQRAATYLSLFNYPVDAIVSNRILPENSSDAFFSGICERQREYRDLIYSSFAPLPILEVPMKGHEVTGIKALGELGMEIYGEQDPTESLYSGKTQEIVKIDGEYILQLALPNLEVDKVNMVKKGDELFVEIGNFKRDLLLPHALAARNAKSARFKDGILHVHFSN
ncbi:ArsA family ATPase [Candidatus Chlorohelix sp.]|uniref:ArsA family ATPase n=1 Tax=Candidatus Chlorohelix sp. TaxID=3139201 RepID=UPI003029D1B2